MNNTYLLQKIKLSGYRLTSQRKNVLAIFQKAHKPLTLKEIEAQLIEKKTLIDTSTIYRIIELFIKLNIVRHTECSTQHTYTLLRQSKNHQINLICTDCGKIKKLSIKNRVLQPILQESNFQNQTGFTTAYGLCNQCH